MMQLAWFKCDTCQDSEDISQSREFYSRLNEGGGGGGGPPPHPTMQTSVKFHVFAELNLR